MTSSEVIEAEGATEVEHDEPAAAMLPVPAAPAPTLAVAPQVSAADLVERLDSIKSAAETAMTEGVDFGNVPGTDKPTLFKPGAEKLGVLFQLDVQIAVERSWGPGDHLTATAYATVFHAPTGARLGSGEGVCTTRERKYAYRKQQRTCPDCGSAAVIKGKEEYGGGWLCFAKKGGCGHKWPDGAEVIESQEVGEIDNPDLPDLWNVVLKMARKRARVDAVLAVTGASAIFTQDVEDGAGVGGAPSPAGERGGAANVGTASPPPAADASADSSLRSLTKLFDSAGIEAKQRNVYLDYIRAELDDEEVRRLVADLNGDKAQDAYDSFHATAMHWRDTGADLPKPDQTDLPPAE